MATNALLELRQATREWHRSVDHHPVLHVLLSKELSVPAYSTALSALHGVQAWYESAVLVSLPMFFGADRRCPKLTMDLQEVGWTLEERPFLGPDVESLEEVLGAAYVIEGSRLGARHLAAVLRKRVPDLPRRYFEEGFVAERWARFTELVEQALDRPALRLSAAASARATFELLVAHLDAVGSSESSVT
jgi:heme oxygenase